MVKCRAQNRERKGSRRQTRGLLGMLPRSSPQEEEERREKAVESESWFMLEVQRTELVRERLVCVKCSDDEEFGVFGH